MNKRILAVFILGMTINLNAQNINDNKFSFQYTQLPMIKVDDRFSTYELRIEHAYQQANQDSTNQYNARQQAIQNTLEMQLTRYQFVRDSIDKDYLRKHLCQHPSIQISHIKHYHERGAQRCQQKDINNSCNKPLYESIVFAHEPNIQQQKTGSKWLPPATG